MRRSGTTITLAVILVFVASCSSKSSSHERDPSDANVQSGGSGGSSAASGAGGSTGGAGAGQSGTAGTSGAGAGTGGSSGSAGSSGASGGGSAGASGSATDASAGSGGAAQDAGRCSGTAGPTMVEVSGFCIDSSEVSKSHYLAFLTAKGSDVSGQDAWCSWNTTYVPSFGWPPTADQNHPVSYVDWCDAFAFCKWAGKRLCGRIGGGANGFADYSDPARSQWHAACAGGSARQYPYGNAYDGAKCVGADYDGVPGYQASTDVPRPTGTRSCEGGFPGIYDLSGNVWEWEDSCDATTGRNDGCRVRGGSFRQLDPATELSCAGVASSGVAPRSSVAAWGGFRCCS